MRREILGTVYLNDVHAGDRIKINYDYWHPDSHVLNALAYTNQHRDCKNDHGDRTNRKLKDQPFYQRNKSGKMRGW